MTFNGGILNTTASFATTRSATLTGTGTVETDPATTFTHSGILGSTGSLVKTGTGILVLGGANTYSGGTTISAGTLQGTTSSLQGAIVNNASVIFDQTISGTYTGIMSGTGSLTKSGTTITTFSGNSPGFIGPTTIAAGSLSIIGNLSGSSITVSPAAFS